MVERQFAHNNGIQSGNGRVAIIQPPPPIVEPTPTHPKWVTSESEQKQNFGKKIQIKDEMSTLDRAVLFAAEFGGTAILVFIGCMGCSSGVAGGLIPHEQISFTFGLAVMVAIQVFGHISGSHINPIVTVAAVILGDIPLIQFPIYFFGQLLGALAGFGVLKAVTPSKFINPETNSTVKAVGLCSPQINPELTVIQGLLVEFTISLILVLVCAGVWDQRNSNKHDSVPIRFGFTIAVLAMAAGPYSGANMNPVRSFAPALFNGDWENQWVYWVGPLGAAVVGGFVYKFIFTKEAPESDIETVEGLPLNDKA